MDWNWQHPDWPNFRWDEQKLTKAETRFIENAGVTIGVSKHLAEPDKQHLSVELLSHEAIDTSAIEGERLGSGPIN